MASLFGSVATEVGEGIQDIALQKREDRISDEEHQRQVQLQKQRLRHDSDLTDKRISADDRRETRRQEYETTMFEQETEASVEAAETAHGYDMEKTSLQEQSDIVQTIISNYMRSTQQRRMSGDGWNVDFEDRQSIDPATGEFVFTEIVNATAPSGRPYRIMGDKAFPAGEQNPQIYPFQSIEQQRQAEAALYDGRVTVEQYRDDFGYIPADYIFGKVSREEQGLRDVFEAAGVTMPAWQLPQSRSGGGSGGKKEESPESRILRPRMEEGYEYQPGAEMKPSIEELSEGPARDAHIAAQGGKTNAQLAAEMRAEAGGGVLAQEQAVEQGGNLKSELDDQRAADIASNIQQLMQSGQELGGTY
jgi:hypothetical protein